MACALANSSLPSGATASRHSLRWSSTSSRCKYIWAKVPGSCPSKASRTLRASSHEEPSPAAFAKTMETWNGYVEAKNDPDFGRTSFANPLNNGPFYAIKVTAGVHRTMGGVTINSATEVLKADGTAIPGLFAAGEVTGGVHGANRLGGTAVADFVVFGRIAGDSAAACASAQ